LKGKSLALLQQLGASPADAAAYLLLAASGRSRSESDRRDRRPAGGIAASSV